MEGAALLQGEICDNKDDAAVMLNGMWI